MKILRVTSLGYESGGAENGIVLLQPHLEKKGYEVKTFSSDVDRDNESFFADYTFPAISKKLFLLRALYRIWNPHSYSALKKVIKEYSPDVVQLHSMYEVSPSVLFLLRNIPTIATVHGAEDYTKQLLIYSFPKKLFKEGRESNSKHNLNIQGIFHYLFHTWFIRPVYLLGLRNVDVFLVMSTYMKDMLQREGITARVIRNATQLFPPHPLNEDAQEVIYVGRLERVKGVQYAIRAMKNVCEKNEKAHMTIVGEGEYREDLENLTKDLNITECITFIGHKNRSEIEQIYRSASIVVIPSLWPEPFGKVGIEAMSVGRIAVASDVGGINEWLKDGENGYLVEPANTEALTEKISYCLNHKEVLRGLSDNAKKQAQQFSFEQYVRHIDSLYKEII